jgi:predicted acyl esterase
MRTSITTLAFRNAPLGNRQSYTPGEIVELNIESVPIIWNVKAGNSLRIDIKSSNFPEYSVHSNYAGVWSLQSKTRIAHKTLYIGGVYNTSITFPVIDLD